MSAHVVQINFGFSSSAEAYSATYLPYAEPLAQMPGLLWKIWLMNEGEAEAGGVYLFADAAAARVFVESPPVLGLRADSTLRDLSIRVSAVLQPHTTITRGPVAVAAAQ